MNSMKVFITKYALTKGIIEAEGELNNDGWINAEYTDEKGYLRKDFLPPRCFVISREEAIKASDEMRKKKIKTLKKQIEKLEKMKFK